MNLTPRKHILLFAAVVFLLIAGFLDPGILYKFACHVGIMTVAFMVACAFLAVKGIRRLAEVFLRKPVRPWYCRPGIFLLTNYYHSVEYGTGYEAATLDANDPAQGGIWTALTGLAEAIKNIERRKYIEAVFVWHLHSCSWELLCEIAQLLRQRIFGESPS
jgi:hypothetical protein